MSIPWAPTGLSILVWVLALFPACQEPLDPCRNDLDCRNGASCLGGSCACAEGYVGKRCQECDSSEGWHWNSDKTGCTQDLCDPNPCPGRQEICAPDTGECACGGATCWALAARIGSPQARSGEMLGTRIVSYAEWVVVSAETGNAPGLPGSGAVYVYHCPERGSCDRGTQLLPTNPRSGRFGASLAMDGDTILVGAPTEDQGGALTGAAYVFARTTSGWEERQHLLPPGGEPNGRFGEAVAVSGDYAAIGTPGRTVDAKAGAGVVTVYHRNAANTWDEVAVLQSPTAGPGDLFGSALALDGEYLLAGAPGAPRESEPDQMDAGTAYVFQRLGATSWDAGFKLGNLAMGEQTLFGLAVGLRGDYAIVGVPGSDLVRLDAGQVEIFHRLGNNTWALDAELFAPGARMFDRFGTSVGIGPGVAVVGSPYRDRDPVDLDTNEGAVFAFAMLGPTRWDNGRELDDPEGQREARLGAAVSTDGQWLVAGAPRATNGQEGGLDSAGVWVEFR